MSGEVTVEARARVHAALGDPTRLAVVDALTLGDASPGALAASLGIGSNLLAHHLKALEAVGLVSRLRSESDRRRAYLHLERDLLSVLHPTEHLRAARVVFVCTHNSARSQLARALWQQVSDVPAASAGTHPARRVHPRAVRTARRHGLALDAVRPARVQDVLDDHDLVVTVCDSAYEQLEPHLGARAETSLHWSVPDPALVDTDAAFEAAFAQVAARVEVLAPSIRPA